MGSNDLSAEERERLGKLFPIEIVPYDPNWPQLYEEEARFLRERFGPELIVRIEHYGSTAVPGLAAKPVIDILVEITSFEAAKAGIQPVLENLGYGYNWYSEHMVFFKGYFSEGAPRYHLHMAPGDHTIMDGLLFRDYLLKHPEAAREYEALKYRLAEIQHFDREAYTEAKTTFVREITEKAKRELGE
ncbi:MAG TPA: GrpB family protein [Armatimonadota bacterium]|nr:GrpB family protein [Armatimonadota bacterium]